MAANKNKNKYYRYIIDEAELHVECDHLAKYIGSFFLDHVCLQVEKLKETAKERTDIAKALIRASQKAKNPDKDKNKEAATQKDDSKASGPKQKKK